MAIQCQLLSNKPATDSNLNKKIKGCVVILLIILKTIYFFFDVTYTLKALQSLSWSGNFKLTNQKADRGGGIMPSS